MTCRTQARPEITQEDIGLHVADLAERALSMLSHKSVDQTQAFHTKEGAIMLRDFSLSHLVRGEKP